MTEHSDNSDLEDLPPLLDYHERGFLNHLFYLEYLDDMRQDNPLEFENYESNVPEEHKKEFYRQMTIGKKYKKYLLYTGNDIDGVYKDVSVLGTVWFLNFIVHDWYTSLSAGDMRLKSCSCVACAPFEDMDQWDCCQ